MMLRRVSSLLIAALFASASPVRADPLTAQKKADIGHLLDMTGALAMGQQMADFVVAQFLQQVKTLKPNISQKVVDVAKAEVSATIADHLPGFEKLIVARYADHFTHGEIRELIAFYGTTVGKKTIREMPVLMRECMAAGQEWGQSLGPEIERRLGKRLKEEGLELPK